MPHHAALTSHFESFWSIVLWLLASCAKLAAKLVLARNAEEPYSYFFSRQGKEKRRWNLLIDFYHLRTNFSSKRNLREKNEGARVEIELFEFRQSKSWLSNPSLDQAIHVLMNQCSWLEKRVDLAFYLCMC